MTSRTLRLKWTTYLALILVCQTVRPIEGYPRASSEMPEESPDAGSSSPQDALSISRVIEEAYEQKVFLRPQEWPQKINNEDNNCCSQRIEQTQRSTSKEKFSSDGMIQRRSKRSLQDSSTNMSMYRRLDMPHRDAGMSMHRNSEGKIIFPDDRISSETSMLPTLTCRKSTFCENVADYPRQLVNTAIQRNASLRFLESVDTIDWMSDVDAKIGGIDARLLPESVLCPIREQVVYPQTAQNKENQWLFIVNQDDLKQGIRIEVCLNEDQKCNMVEGFAEGYETSCKQKYIYRELAAVRSDGNIYKDQFRFPSSCCCHVKFTGDPASRLGTDNLPVNQTQ